MPRILVMEGNPAQSRKKAQKQNIKMAGETYADIVRRYFPAIDIDTVYAADRDAEMPSGTDLKGYDGFIVGGSGLHCYDTTFEVLNQIELLKQATDAGLPVLGSCWGLQIAALAGGGAVERSPIGREIGVARKIHLTAEGQAHPLYAGKRLVFDSPCIHYDEVVKLPSGSTVLASNKHSHVQAAIIPLANSEVWAMQYHPEFELSNIAQLLGLYAADMMAEGFFKDEASLNAYIKNVRILASDPANKAASWQLAIDSDILDNAYQTLEIQNWVKAFILK
ncbi:type 1 glutamine amidotransferase [Kordiimonas pumila]|uniref:Type 1 glutamine amidotransferase n=1 Tax=Kordiimonas pumila TaxID=2161677 RepID=A0ABV7D5M1_9PROT|nr:type 1 glutamine amidotransferase [Kordiimonas pumila]